MIFQFEFFLRLNAAVVEQIVEFHRAGLYKFRAVVCYVGRRNAIIKSGDRRKQPLPTQSPKLMLRTLASTIFLVAVICPALFAQPSAIKKPDLPPAREGRDHPVDRLVDAYFAQHGVKFPPPVDDATFARRVYLDFVGLLPTEEQLETFLADGSVAKREKLIDSLLADQVAYADHWLTFWNDLLRNDYAGTGYIDGGRKQITKWLYAALIDNMPYDRFVRELISPSPESEGFINGIKWRGNVNAAQSPELQFAQNVGQVFLGVNLKCASCHDSFIDDWKLTDSWGLAAVIADHPLEIYRCDVPTGKTAAPAFLFPELGSIDPDLPRKERLEQLSRLITDPHNGRLPRTLVNRLWQRLLGRGIVNPVDSMDGTPWSAETARLSGSGVCRQRLRREKAAAVDCYVANLSSPLRAAAGMRKKATRRLLRPGRAAVDGRAIHRRRLANYRHDAEQIRLRRCQKVDRHLRRSRQRTGAGIDHEMRFADAFARPTQSGTSRHHSAG